MISLLSQQQNKLWGISVKLNLDFLVENLTQIYYKTESKWDYMEILHVANSEALELCKGIWTGKLPSVYNLFCKVSLTKE